MIVLSDKGQLNYLDAETGKDFWQDAIPRARAKYYSSPILAGDLLYCAREDGVVTVIKVNDNGMEIVAQNDMGEKIAATPVFSDGRILLRGAEHLYCIGSDN